jgi:hypothetical protein
MPAVVLKATKTSQLNEKTELGLMPLEQAFRMANRSSYLLLFEPGAESEDPLLGANSMIGTSVDPGVTRKQRAALSAGRLSLKMVPNTENYPELKELRFGHLNGARKIGVISISRIHENNDRVFWTKFESDRGKTRSWISYSICDGNGLLRHNLRGKVSGYETTLQCKSHNPVEEGHSLLRLPDPAGAYERLSMDEWFAEQSDRLWLFREQLGSSPFRESLELMPSSQKSDLPIRYAVIFAGGSVDSMVKELEQVFVSLPKK